MICYQSMYRTLNEFPGLNVQLFSGFFDFFLKVPGDGAGEMYLCLLEVILHYVSGEEVVEATDKQGLDFRLFPMVGEERGEACQKAVGLRLAIHFVNDLG